MKISEYSHGDEYKIIEELKHFLPSQAPLKDFIHHNTLHAFQHDEFEKALFNAAQTFGYRVYLSLDQFRMKFREGEIEESILDEEISIRKGNDSESWKRKMLEGTFNEDLEPEIGRLRNHWKSRYRIDMDSMVHPLLFRILSSYLDQGIAIWGFPVSDNGFLASLADLERNSKTSFFKTDRARKLLIDGRTNLSDLLKLIVGNKELYERYLFDQQFAHPGWSGMVAVIEGNNEHLLDKRKITLEEFICFELLLEIDVLDDHFGGVWSPIGVNNPDHFEDLFSHKKVNEYFEVLHIFQASYEWTYYQSVLRGIGQLKKEQREELQTFDALFCIDDRECSIRRHLESQNPGIKTYGTAGFFNVEFFYQPEESKFYTKVCPAPLTPKYLIKEESASLKKKKDFHFGHHSHGLFLGWIFTHTLGFWSALRLFLTVFKPQESASMVTSFGHMDPRSKLTIENKNGEKTEDGLQIGFTIHEMADRLEGLLRSIGLISNFGKVIYAIGHGSSSVNNTHYAGYDCGACSGRPGSVNARVIAHIGNHQQVRSILREKGIDIPDETVFVGALHDTSRDEIMYYDLDVLSPAQSKYHQAFADSMSNALDFNAKERSRRFVLTPSHGDPKKVHEKVKLRTISLFEPRPELNHATNTLCIVGRRELTKNLFLDRRAFLNSYDYSIDPEGKYLTGILNAVAPVCGGINLEYFFSRVDNQKLGAGTKLPHNVMGLIGVANGIDGDLRTGLPSQMIEVHDPLRLLVIVEHDPEVVLNVLINNPKTYEWFLNGWVNLCVLDPMTSIVYRFLKGELIPSDLNEPLNHTIADLMKTVEVNSENLPVSHLIPEEYGTAR
ncbi:MAG: DUF2309 domain-containing protein [Bacteroidetes bacterium]|nr:MAG: DUF2309 domain-containing protein [Bacteroidota bacterium]